MFQNMIKPDAGATPISFPKWMGNVHLHIFFNDLIEIRLRHLVNVRKRRIQIHKWRKAEIPLGQIHGPQLARERINISKKNFVNFL